MKYLAPDDLEQFAQCCRVFATVTKDLRVKNGRTKIHYSCVKIDLEPVSEFLGEVFFDPTLLH